MCEICQGASDDEILFGIHGRIARFGWAVEYVQGARASKSWGYTIGLTQSFGVPELAIAEGNMRRAVDTMNAVAHAISHGDFPTPGELFLCEGREYLLVDVHPNHLDEGTFGMWEFYYNRIQDPPEEHRVLEIVPPGRSSRFSGRPRGHGL